MNMLRRFFWGFTEAYSFHDGHRPPSLPGGGQTGRMADVDLTHVQLTNMLVPRRAEAPTAVLLLVLVMRHFEWDI